MRKSGFLMILFLSPLVFTIPIAHCNESDEVQEWIAELKDKDPRIRQTAAEILGRLKDPRAIGPLILALVDEASEVQEAVFEALKSFPGWEKSDEANRVVPELIVVLQDQRKDPEVRKNAAEALGKIKDPKAVEPLITTLKDKDSEVRWHAAEALEKITKEHFGREVAKWEEWLKKQKAGE